MPITKDILKICLQNAEKSKANKIAAIYLSIGEMHDIEEEWMQRYMDYTSRNTIAEGAKIKIRRLPVIAKCGRCDESYPINLRQRESFPCPQCGSNQMHIVSGRELFIEQIEVI